MFESLSDKHYCHGRALLPGPLENESAFESSRHIMTNLVIQATQIDSVPASWLLISSLLKTNMP